MNIKPFISKKFLGFAGLALASAVVFRDGIAFAMGDRVSYFTGKEVAWTAIFCVSIVVFFLWETSRNNAPPG